ncbi:MAG: acyltransferase family protein [Eubacteriales bacterium]|nr:acyltransferase family protein [Eubacteriales bacterium]
MRRTELDLCRITACQAVILSHAAADGFHMVPIESGRFWVLCLVSTVVRASIPQFFMISGTLLLGRETMDPWRTLKKRTGHLVVLFYVWSLAYALLRAATGAFGSFYDFAYAVVIGHYHLWFLPAMTVVYLFMPPVHAAIHGNKMDPRYLLFLFFFLGIFLTNCNLTPDAMPILYRFTLNFGLDYLPHLGYAVWGWWLARRQMPRRTLWLAPLVFVLTLLLTTQANCWYSAYKETADGWLFNFFSLPNFVMGTAGFCFFLALRDRSFPHAGTVAAISDCTLGVYLLHPMLLNMFKRLGLVIRPEHVLGDTALRYVLLVAAAFPAAWLLRRIPGIRRLLS